MAAGTAPIFEAAPIVKGVTVVPADTTSKKTIATGGANGSRIDAIMVSSDDTAAVNLAFWIYDGSTDYYIGNVVVPIGSGYTTVARVDALNTLSPSLGYLVLPSSSHVLKCSAVATVTAAKTVTVVAMGGDY